jgi:hypothetical protein
MGALRSWWRDPALGIFLWSRVAIWAGVVLFAFWLRGRHAPALPGGYLLDVWGHWDGEWFVQIAKHSYGSRREAAAFFPLYPGMLAVLGRVFGGEYVAAGVVLSLGAAAAAFVFLRRLTALELGEETALRATVILAVFPLSLFLQAVYSESTYLALALGAFLAARTGRWALASGALAGAVLVRPTALALFVALGLLAWRSPARRRALAWIVPAPLIFVLFPLTLWQQAGDPFLFAHAEKYWHRELSALGPFGGVIDGARAAWHGVGDMISPHQHADWIYPAGLDLQHTGALNVEAFVFLLLYLALAVAAWRMLGAAYGLFCVISLALPLSTPWSVLPLYSLPRFGLVIFPFFMVLGAIASTPRRYTAIVVCSVVLLAADVARWALGLWVA